MDAIVDFIKKYPLGTLISWIVLFMALLYQPLAYITAFGIFIFCIFIRSRLGDKFNILEPIISLTVTIGIVILTSVL